MDNRIDLSEAELIEEMPDGSALYRVFIDGRSWDILVDAHGNVLQKKLLRGGSDPRQNGPMGNVVKRPI